MIVLERNHLHPADVIVTRSPIHERPCDNDENYIFSQEAHADTSWAIRMSYSLDGDSTLQKRTLGKWSFKNRKSGIHARSKAFSNFEWIDTLFQSRARILERSATQTKSHGTEYCRDVSECCNDKCFSL